MRSLLLTLALLAAGTGAAAETPREFPVDGWYSWQVAAVDDAPGWCCVDWNRGRSTATACDLDANDFNFGHFNFADGGSRAKSEDELQVYALIRGGQAVRVRAMSPACPVESRGSITDLGRVEPAASLAWLRQWVRDDDSNALAAIALHRGPESLAFLTDLALHEDDEELREEAVFALSELPDDRAVGSLTQIVSDTGMDLAIREQALFWLAQSDSDEAYETIDALLSKRD